MADNRPQLKMTGKNIVVAVRMLYCISELADGWKDSTNILKFIGYRKECVQKTLEQHGFDAHVLNAQLLCLEDPPHMHKTNGPIRENACALSELIQNNPSLAGLSLNITQAVGLHYNRFEKGSIEITTAHRSQLWKFFCKVESGEMKEEDFKKS